MTAVCGEASTICAANGRWLGLSEEMGIVWRSKSCHRLAWRDRVLYDWLLGIGLTPAKSLTLGVLLVPDAYFVDFFRGCIDGDGSILAYTDRYHGRKNERYIYDRLCESIVSARRQFIDVLPGKCSLPRAKANHG